MAKTYKATLKSIQITLMSGGDAIEVQDEIGAPFASQALAEFESCQTMHVPDGEGGTIYIPFHAVMKITVTTAQSDPVEIDDAVCGSIDGK